MMFCAVCHARLNFFYPDLFVCPTGHYAIRVTMSTSEHSELISGGLHGTLPRSWDDDERPPARTPVHPCYHEAFKDVEVIEP